jgi:hypothetical protein
MRITLTIPTNATQAPPQRKTDPPLVQLAGTGERVLIELQGELGYEGDPCGRVVGLLSFERMVSLLSSYDTSPSPLVIGWWGDWGPMYPLQIAGSWICLSVFWFWMPCASCSFCSPVCLF